MTIQQIFKGTLVVLLTLLAAYALFMSGRVLMVLLVAVIVASAVRPLVTIMTRWRIPEGAAIVAVYLTLLTAVIVVLVAVIPPVLNQIAFYIEDDGRLAARIITAQRLVENTISGVTQSDVSLVAPDDIREAVSNFVAQVRRLIPDALENIGASLGDAVLIFVMGAYWLTSHARATAFITQLAPHKYRPKVKTVIDEIELSMGGYVRGMVLIAVIVGVMHWVAFSLLNVPNALTLSFIIAIASTVPMIGGLIGGIIALFMTLVVSPYAVPAVFIVFFIIQQIQNYYLTPRIMAGRVGVDALLVIVYTAIGFVMFGLVGALVFVPLMGTVHILLTHSVIEPYQEAMQAENGLLLAKPLMTTKDAIQIARHASEA